MAQGQREAIGQCARIRILARDVSLSLADEQASSILNRLPATVIGMADDTDRAMLLIRLAVGDAMLLARISKNRRFSSGFVRISGSGCRLNLWLFCIDQNRASDFMPALR